MKRFIPPIFYPFQPFDLQHLNTPNERDESSKMLAFVRLSCSQIFFHANRPCDTLKKRKDKRQMIKMKPIQNRFTPPWNLQKNDGCENVIDTFVKQLIQMNV